MPLGWGLPREPRGRVTLRSAVIQLRDMEDQAYLGFQQPSADKRVKSIRTPL